MSLTKIENLSSYFQRVDDKWIFQGRKLEVFIPRVYQDRDLLTLGDVATTLGIFQIRINDSEYANFMILGKISIEFLASRIEKEDNYEYVVLTLERGSAFVADINIVKSSDTIYDIFIIFLALGKIPPFLNYDAIQALFDNDEAHCGIKLKVNHAIVEMIFAHIFRDRKDPYMYYRLTPMTESPVIVPIRQISHGPSSTSARITGSYLTEGLTASLVDDTERPPSLIENLLRS